MSTPKVDQDPAAHVRPKVFHLGVDRCGAAELVDVFDEAGFTSCWPHGDAVADDIFYSERLGVEPLTRFQTHDLFVDLESSRQVFRPELLAFREFGFLRSWFPDAYFLLFVGELDGIIEDRSRRRGRDFLRAAAHHHGCALSEVPALWRDQFEQHVAAVRAFFEGSPRFLEIDVRRDHWSALTTFLREDYDLSATNRRGTFRAGTRRPRKAAIARQRGRVASDDPQFRSPDVVEDLVEFATSTDSAIAVGMPRDFVSKCFAQWLGGESVLNRRDLPIPCAVDLSQSEWPFIMNAPTNPKHARTEGVLNEAWRHGMRRGLVLDMQDARRYGTVETGAPRIPVVTYTRVRGASNLVLWPLPGYHSPGARDYPDGTLVDSTPFRSKRDQVVWRGNLTGRAIPALGSDVASDQHAQELALAVVNGDEEALRALRTVPRFRVAARVAGRPGYDVGFVLGPSLGPFRRHEAFRHLSERRIGYHQLYQSRYILSLSGNDTGSNFLKASDSNSVVLKEEDGWEAFYSSQFQPWHHYIPLGRGADDLEAKVEWARGHERECIEMSAAARHSVALIVNAQNRKDYLHGVVDVLSQFF